MLEPATTLTDYALTLLCAVLAARIWRGTPAGFMRSAFVVMFGGVAVAAFLGGTVHGFLPDPASAASRALWSATLLSIGATSAAMIAVGARAAFGTAVVAPLKVVLPAALFVYVVVVLFVSQEFVVAIGGYLVGAILMLVAFARRWRRTRHPEAMAGVAGIVLVLLGAVGQQAGVALHPVHFDHNAVYHVVQMVALCLLYVAAKDLAASAASDVAA